MKKKTQPKDEHPMSEEWGLMREMAEEQGIENWNGPTADPPIGGSVIASLDHLPYKMERPPYDPSIISKVY